MPAAALGDTVNVEVSFTPYPGEVGGATEVRTVAGRVELVLNGVPMLDNPLAASRALVMGTGPSGPELSPAFWLPLRALQPVLRRGPNLLQLRFTPQDGRIRYESQFRWVVVSDQTTTTTTAQGATLSTNQVGEGGERRQSQGPVTFEHRFEAPFARVEPWHSDSPIQALEAADRAAILGVLAGRAALFSPDFAPDFTSAYASLAALPTDRGLRFDLPAMRGERCLERGHAAGVRLAAPALDQVRLITTGSPVVVARGVGPSLFRPANLPGTEARLAALPEDAGFCFAVATGVLFPPQLLLVKGPGGQWRALD
ncbi:hypothetical protein [Synechococcus sp. CS-1332]|uniref:hypothetical protein n=1 Tax=Synechococcus sp. CS-1332 TaxID=2847972 RepID=UPI00223B5B3F|nr:hypothetical protein [Synechococcus sp. CS-1332]